MAVAKNLGMALFFLSMANLLFLLALAMFLGFLEFLTLAFKG